MLHGLVLMGKLNLKMPKLSKKQWERLKTFFSAIGAVSTAGGIVLFLANTFFDFDFKFDATKRFQDQFDSKVQPLVRSGIEAAREAKAAGQGGREEFKAFMAARVGKSRSGDAVVEAAEILDSLVKCKKSWGCTVKDYSRYTNAIQDFWFAYRGYLEPLREGADRADLALQLQQAAERSLAEDRKNKRVR